MARGRMGGTAGFAVALVIVSIFFVLALLMAIVGFTQAKEAQDARAEAESDLGKYVRSGEKSDPRVVELMTDAQRSAVGQLLAERSELRQLLSGSPDLPTEQIKRDITRALGQIEPVLPAVRRMKENLNAEREALEEAERARDEALDAVAQMETQRAQQEQAYGASIESLRSELGEVQTGYMGYREGVEDQRETLQSRFEETQQQFATTIGEKDAEIRRLEAELRELQRRIDEIINPTAGGEGGTTVDLSRIPDGKITSVVRDAPLVYVNVGARQHVLLGTPFEVYDAGTGIVADEFGELRGKATVEIIRVEENASLARIVRQDRGAIITEGDIIGNVVFDPQATYKFYVFGEFDIDNSGQATIQDRRRIESMISNWGGELSNQLNYDVDFLVLGEPPTLPEPLPPETIDPVLIREHQEATQRYERYQDLLVQASKLQIPVLNQNRFLAMIGYYQR